MNSVYAGTSGFSYKEWKGHFYPAGLKDGEFLAFYGSELNAVEINNSFYRLPRREVLTGWADQTPAHFRFVIKASRRITHFKRLKDVDEPLGYLLKNTAVLGDRLGALLFQLPPNLRCNLDRLNRFVELLPEDCPAVMEFRHESWMDDAVFDVLKSRNIAVCIVDDEDSDGPGTNFPVTADWCYCRLRRPGYDKAGLKAWADFLAKSDFRQSFVFFKHETDGAGPLMAKAFLGSLSRRKTLQVA